MTGPAAGPGAAPTARAAALAETFRRFAARECPDAPLYRRLAETVAGDPELLALAAHAAPGQPAPNVLLAAVHLRLREAPGHPLAAFYPGLAAVPRVGDPRPAFRAFCRQEAEALRALVGTRRVQTNEVQRAACLLPAFAEVARRAGGRPLAFVEIGASAGLLLAWDRYAYDYGDGRLHGDPASPVRLRCETRGPRRPPPPEPWPGVAARVGIDPAPVDLRDPGDVRWLRALVWPDHAERAARLEAAAALVRADPPRVVRGDGTALAAEVLDALPAGVPACVFHAFTLNQVAPSARARLDGGLRRAAARRLVFRVGLEWEPREAPGLTLEAVAAGEGPGGAALLARAGAHGGWLRWLA